MKEPKVPNPTTTAPAHRPRLSPDREQLKRYINQGLTQQEIADAWFKQSGNRVTRNAINMAIKNAGLTPMKPRPRYDDLIPWRVALEHTKQYDARMLRAAARIAAKKKRDRMSDPDYKRLQSWLADLELNHAVVAYTRQIGFVWMPRLDTDAPNDIIRRPGLPQDPYDGE